jgi:hypothetical protein
MITALVIAGSAVAVYIIGRRIMATLDDLKAAIAANTSATASVTDVVNHLVARIQALIDAQAPPEDFQALVDELSANNTSIADAVTAGTAAEGDNVSADTGDGSQA